ncbi:MAG: TolC family protein [Planctomycetota bacterium]
MKISPSNLLLLVFACSLVIAVGCSPSKPIYLKDTGGLSYYVDKATAVEYPDADIPSLEEVTHANRPMTVIDPEFTSFEDVTLEDCVSMALLNTKVVRGYGTPSLQGTRVVPGQDTLENGSAAAATTYDIAIRESEPGFISQPGSISSPSSIVTNTALDGNQGVEAALADFDASYTSSFDLSTSDEPRNGTSILNSEVFTQKQFSWQNQFAKKTANGTQLFFRNINQWTENNNPLVADGGIQILDSFYRASFEAEVRQPLLRGRGAFIQRMPIVISRISTDQQIANLESTLQNMVTNVEIRYWDLYLAYRNFEAAKTGRDAALQTWRIVKDKLDEGADVNIQNVAQAAEQYHFFDAQVIDAYNSLLNAEGQLRYLLGWASTDGRFMRPIDDAVMAPIEFDWFITQCEALTYRPEIRQERWEIKKRELALQYAKNGLLPEFNLSFVYRWLGLGNRYGTSGDSQGFPDASSAALNELYGGNFQELSFGGTLGIPIGFRREEANVRNAQLKLARQIARAEDLELDISKNLSEAIRALAANQMIMRTAFNRWISTTQEIDHWERAKEAGVATLDVSLDSQRRRAQAEIAFHTAVVEYNKSIALIHRRKGTVLAYSGVEFSEGPWPGKAYVDASEHARRRSASRQINYGWTRPQVISRGENYTPNSNTGYVAPANPLPANPAPMIAPADNIYMDQSMPYDGSIQSVPNGDMSAPANGVTPAVPTFADPSLNQTSLPQISQQVQQVSYNQPAEPVQQPAAVESNSASIQPVAVRIQTQQPSMTNAVRIRATTPNPNSTTTNVRPQQPERDPSVQPANRLRAKTPTVNEATRSAAPPTTKRANTAHRVQWERLGLTRPDSGQVQTTARIKTN